MLFLAYGFPPANAIGCVRAWNIAKYLTRLGWEVCVVTPDPIVWRNINDPSKVVDSLRREGITRLVTGHKWRCLLPDGVKCWNTNIGWCIGGICRKAARYYGIDAYVGWRKEVETVCSLLLPNDIDVILASGPPSESFRLAKRLSVRLRCPYVLDYRDPCMPPASCKPSRRAAILHEEMQLINDASAVTIISPSLLKGKVGLKAKLHVITNGFDPEELACIAPNDFGHFAIVYAGTFYPPKRVITPMMKALKCLKEKETRAMPGWRFHYYGPQGDHVLLEAQRLGVLDKVLIHGHVTRDEALSAVRGSSLTVVITSVVEENAEQDGGIVTGKLFEIVGMGVPTLVIGPNGADVDQIVRTTGLAHKVTASDIAGMVSFLQGTMSGAVPTAGNPALYAWPNIIGKLDGILRSVIEKRIDQVAKIYGSDTEFHVPPVRMWRQMTGII